MVGDLARVHNWTPTIDWTPIIDPGLGPKTPRSTALHIFLLWTLEDNTSCSSSRVLIEG